jgi:hypothetical protein
VKITVNTANLNGEQMKFLSQLGEFRGDNDETWVGGCDACEFDEAMEWLRRDGITDVFVEFGEGNRPGVQTTSICPGSSTSICFP